MTEWQVAEEHLEKTGKLGKRGKSRTDAERLSSPARMIKILMLLASQSPRQKWSLQDLADECGCSTRSISRSFKELGELHVPFIHDSKAKTYRLIGDWIFPAITFDAADVLALAVAQGLFHDKGTPQGPQIRAALAKATAGLPGPLKAQLEAYGRVFQPDSRVRDYSAAPSASLVEAAARQETVEIFYDSFSGQSMRWRCVDPYNLTERDGRFYAQLWCHERRAFRDFALERIRDLRGTDRRFERRAAEWEAYENQMGIIGGLRGGEPIIVNVLFSEDAARYALTEPWEPPLTITALPDGAARLTGTVLGPNAILNRILAWRSLARVEGGPELRARICEELDVMQALYQDGV